MSSEAIAAVLKATDVTIYEKAFLVQLADVADSVGVSRKCHVKHMARRCRCSTTSIYRAIRSLVGKGMISEYGKTFLLHLEVIS